DRHPDLRRGARLGGSSRTRTGVSRRIGVSLLVIVTLAALAAPVLAPHEGDRQFSGLLNAPPTTLRVLDDEGRWHWPFIYPWVLASSTVFLLLASIFSVVGAPFISRGVRAIVRSEKRLDYASAATSLGAGHLRVLACHLLPAARGFVLVEITMLVPAFIVAEA